MLLSVHIFPQCFTAWTDRYVRGVHWYRSLDSNYVQPVDFPKRNIDWLLNLVHMRCPLGYICMWTNKYIYIYIHIVDGYNDFSATRNDEYASTSRCACHGCSKRCGWNKRRPSGWDWPIRLWRRFIRSVFSPSRDKIEPPSGYVRRPLYNNVCIYPIRKPDFDPCY